MTTNQLRQRLLQAVAESTDPRVHELPLSGHIVTAALAESEHQHGANVALADPFHCPDCTVHGLVSVEALFLHLLTCEPFRMVYA